MVIIIFGGAIVALLIILAVVGVRLLRAKRPKVGITFYANTAPAAAAIERLAQDIADARVMQTAATDAVREAKDAVPR